MKKTWIGSIHDIRTNKDAEEALRNTNDKRYMTKHGIIKIDAHRWNQAQDFEKEIWELQSYSRDDRSEEHRNCFDEYKAVPDTTEMDVIEIGCGPFTQTQFIAKTAKTYTLLDPLLNSYLNHPNCPYKNGTLFNTQTTLKNIPAEELDDKEAYDLAICINVLEHVYDVDQVLQNIHESLRPNGTIVFGERNYDDFECDNLYDVGHPIRVFADVLIKFRSKFNVVYQNTTMPGYFIGTKE